MQRMHDQARHVMVPCYSCKQSTEKDLVEAGLAGQAAHLAGVGVKVLQHGGSSERHVSPSDEWHLVGGVDDGDAQLAARGCLAEEVLEDELCARADQS